MKGIYIGAMGMMSSQKHINARANNIANTDTNGYKFDEMVSRVFEHKNAHRNEGNSRTFIGGVASKVTEEGSMINLNPGQFKITDEPLHASLTDKERGQTSFFVVSTNGENLLTRNGEFQVNEERFLKTISGAYALGLDGNKISIPEDVSPNIEKDGSIIDVNTGQLLGQLQIRTVNQENKHLLEKERAAMFGFEGEIGNLPISEAVVEVGTLERSNVDMTKEMVHLLNEQRRFQASQKISMTFNSVYEKEANQLMR